jgi:Carboxypeptidase regulatory-like domain
MRAKTLTRLFALLASLSLLLPAALSAQSSTQGGISGTVIDSSSAVLPGASVKLESLDKGYTRATETSAQGVFQFPLVDPGSYAVEISVTGFKAYKARVTVNVGQVTTANAKLEVGATGTTVEVSGVAPLMETENADMSTSFDRNLVENMPNGGNDLTAIAYTAPGVVMNSGGMYGNFNANGLPATSNMFTVDGENQMDPFLNLNNSGPTNLMLGKNSIDEATVTTNAYSGQFGQQAGAQVNLVSKGGTNQYHGNLQYQWTGRYLDANDWFNGFNQPSQPTPFANNNQWAASFGGPIKKDKTFFFLDTEGIRYIVPSTQTVFTPTASFLNDTLANLGPAGASAATVVTYTQAAKIWENAPNFNNGVPGGSGTCIDAFTQTAPAVSAATLSAGCIQSYTSSPALPASEWLLIGRLDQNIGNKDRVFLRFDIDRGTQATLADPIDPAAFSAASFQPSYNNAVVWNHSFSGTATNQFVAAGSYYRATFIENTNGPTSPFPYSLFLEADSNVNGLNSGNVSFPQGRNVTQYQFVDDFAKTIGRHSLKIGANFRRYDITNYDASTFVTPEVVAGMNDFFGGGATEYFQNNPLHASAPMNTGGIGVYVEDDWSVTPRLKLNLTLRGEHNLNPTCDINCFTILSAPFSQIEAQGADIPYNKALNFGRKDAFNSVDAINFGPRVGFTWSPMANSKTVVSGGFGIFYDAFPAFITDQFVNIPYLVPVGLFGGAPFGSSPIAWGDPTGAAATVLATANTIRNGNSAMGIPSLANGLTETGLLDAGGATPSVTGFPGKLRTPQYQEWNFQVQHEIDSKSRITIAYVGNHGIFEPYPNNTVNASTTANFIASTADPTIGTYAPNVIAGYPTCTPAPYGVTTSQGSCSATPDSRFGTVTQWTSGAISNHHGLTASYNRRVTAGFVVNANYSWSHTLDEISNGSVLPSVTTALQGQINPLSLRANNYGNADYDVRHSLNANYVWTEPFHFESRAMTGFLGGWMLSQNFITRSGLPYTVTDGTTSISNGGTATPVQQLGSAQQSCASGFSQCFNSANLGPATNLGFFPTQVRNQFRGPGFFNSDFTVGKGFQVSERMKITVGANIYNVFNHPNFQNPNRTWTSSTCSTGTPQGSCGQITGQAAPPTGPYGSFFNGLPAGRVGQLQAKIVF